MARRRTALHTPGRRHGGRADRRRRPIPLHARLRVVPPPRGSSGGAASTDPAVPAARPAHGDSGGPAFAYENTVGQPRLRRGRHQLRLAEQLRVLPLRPRARLGASAGSSTRRARHAAAGLGQAARPAAEGGLYPDPSAPHTSAASSRCGSTTTRAATRASASCSSRMPAAALARLPQRPHESLARVRPRQQPEALLGLRLRAGVGRHQETVEHRVRRQPHQLTYSGRQEAIAEPRLGHDQRGMPRVLVAPVAAARSARAGCRRPPRRVAPHLSHDRAVGEEPPGVSLTRTQFALLACHAPPRAAPHPPRDRG